MKIVYERTAAGKPFPLFLKYAGGRLLLGTVEPIVPPEHGMKYRFRPAHTPHRSTDYRQVQHIKEDIAAGK